MSENGCRSQDSGLNSGADLKLVKIVGRVEPEAVNCISAVGRVEASEVSHGGGLSSSGKQSAEHSVSDVLPGKDALLFYARELDCPHCSALIVSDLKKLPYIDDVSYNLLTRTLVLIPKEGCSVPDDITETVRKTVNGYEPEVTVERLEDSDESITTDEGEGRRLFGLDLRNRLIAGFVIFVAALPLFYAVQDSMAVRVVSCICFLSSYLLSGFEVLTDAFRKIRGSFFSEQMLMTIASLGAVAIGEYPEAVAVMLFYQIGEYFQERAVNRSRASIKALLDICPDRANLETPDGIREIRAADIRIGDRVVVRPGEKVPCDGTVVSGHAGVDTSNLTGESVPRYVSSGDDVYSGFISKDGVITVEARKKASDSAASEVIRLVEKAAERKSATENFISVFARYYTPAVVALALITALVPPLLFGGMWSVWIERSLIFLVVSCPCALVISIPLTYFSGIGAASRYGIMVKGSNYLDALGRTGTVFFDKTGTLTRGTFSFAGVSSNGTVSDERILQLASSAEHGSVHPIARSVTEEAERRGIAPLKVTDFTEIPGKGIKAVIDGCEVLVGNDGLLCSENISVPGPSGSGTVIHVACDGVYLGTLIIADTVKSDSVETVRNLKSLGIESVMLSGDNENIVASVASELEIAEYHSSLFPDDKVSLVEERLKQSHSKGHAVAFVGDGINDAPALALADVGIAMGAMGSDAAIEAADAVIMSDEPSKLVTGIRIARKTRTIVKQNIVLALTVKFLLMILGAMGVIGMWFAVFGDVGVMILAVLNSMRMIFRRSSQSVNIPHK